MTAKLNSRFFSANAIIVIALMMLVYTIYSWVTPYAHDDYMFSRYYLDGNNHQESFSLTGLFNYISMVRNVENGRLANYLCAPIVMWMPHWLWSLLFGAIVTASVMLSARLSVGRKQVSARMIVFIWALSVIFWPWQDFSGLVAIDYALNYLLSWLLVLLTWIFMMKVEAKPMSVPLYCLVILLAFSTGMIHESFSTVLVASAAVYAAIRKFRLPAQWWGTFAALIAGLLICVSANGIIQRVIRTAGFERSRDMMYFARLIYHTMSLCAFVGFAGVIMSLSRSGRRHLSSIFANPINVYAALLALFATISIVAAYAPARSAMMAVPPTIILLVGSLQSHWNFPRYFSIIPSAIVLSLILIFYGGLIYWQNKIRQQNDIIVEAMRKAGGKPVYFDTIDYTPWYTFDYPLNGLWSYYSFHEGCVADYLGMDGSKLYVLPKILENIDLKKCDKVTFDDNDGYFQIGNYLLYDGRDDRDSLPGEIRFTLASGRVVGSDVSWKPFDAADGSLWFLGIPAKDNVKGPFLKIES